VLYTIAGLMEFINGMKFKNKKAATFGCYGWHDVSTKIIEDGLKEAGLEIIMDPISVNWKPDDNLVSKCIDYGRQFVTLANK
jgi:anaerobic nitric oxide reductase flavorubredoxin